MGRPVKVDRPAKVGRPVTKGVLGKPPCKALNFYSSDMEEEVLDPVLEKKKKTHQCSSENASDSDDTFAELMDDMRREKDEPVIDESTPGPSRVRKRIERWEVRDDDKSSHTSDDDEDVLGS